MICKKTEACFFELLKSPDVVRCQQKPLCLDFCDTRSEAVCKEKGKVYRLLNKDRLYKILSLHVDGGVIVTDRETPPNVAKCDYLYLIDLEPEPIAILIELKGTDIKRAIEQIKNTLVLFSHAFDKCNKVYGRIVFSGGTPNIQNIPAFMSLQRDFKRRKGSLIANEVLTDSVENIC